MPDKSQTREPDLEIEIVGEYGDTNDPVYNKLMTLVVNTIRDVHLVHARNGRLTTAQMERGEERMLLVFLHDVEVIEGDFDDAMVALLTEHAPLATWQIQYRPAGVVIQGFYLNTMPIEAISV